MGIIMDLTGKQFERLTVMEKSGRNKHRKTLWKCKCVCGNVSTVTTAELINSRTKSCGCLNRERITSGSNYRHGKIKSPEYGPWAAMRGRCHNPKSISYMNYGGRGITVCERWKSFSNFLEDMGPRPTIKHTIERKNVDGNYEPSNCYWVEKEKQARNTRTTNKADNGISLRNDKWIARISVNNKRVFIGNFETKEDALRARKEAELKYWGKSS